MIIVTPKIPILTSLFISVLLFYNLRTPARDHEGPGEYLAHLGQLPLCGFTGAVLAHTVFIGNRPSAAYSFTLPR